MSDSELDGILAEVAAETGSGAEASFDFTGASEGTDFKTPCPPDAYDCVVSKVETGKLSSSGNPKIVFQFKIAAGEWKGKVLFLHTLVSGKASWKTRETLEALGVDCSTPKFSLDPTTLVGKPCVVTVDIQKDNPQYNEIQRVSPVEDAASSAYGD